MEASDIFDRLLEAPESEQIANVFGGDKRHAQLVMNHKTWLDDIRHERPNPDKHYRIGVYIRYFNQTKYPNYLYYHKKRFEDAIALCPNWTIVDFYTDKGATAPNMETAPEWSRLLDDCDDGKIDLILTQKISNVSKKMHEVTFCARALAARTPPVGIYFVSEDLFTLATYYQEDLRDPVFFPTPDWKVLPDGEEESYG